jgi:hypothetical protein
MQSFRRIAAYQIVNYHMTSPCKLMFLLPLIVALSFKAGATSINKAPLCAKATHRLTTVNEGKCVREKATFLVVGSSNARQKVELISLEPTQSLKAWAECIVENWSRTEAGKSSQAGVGTTMTVDLKLGECDS